MLLWMEALIMHYCLMISSIPGSGKKIQQNEQKQHHKDEIKRQKNKIIN